MAKYVYEIINPELFSIRSTESVTNALLGLMAMGVTCLYILSHTGFIKNRPGAQ